MNKENLGIELIQTRYNGLTEIKIHAECEEGFRFKYDVQARFDINKNFHSQETMEEIENEVYNKIKSYLAKGRVILTINGIGESVYDERAYYRITNSFGDEVEVRPFQNDCFGILHTEKFDSKRKANNYIMKVVREVVETIKEKSKGELQDENNEM